jgi:molecular chaperone GrpE
MTDQNQEASDPAERPVRIPVRDQDVEGKTPDREQAPAAPEPPETQADLLARYQRVCADYQNYQRRMAREMQQVRANARAELVRTLLPVLDDLQRAIAHAREQADESHPMLEGVQLIRDKFLAVLKQHDVREIPALGETFDPEVHEAVMTEPRKDVEPQTVLELFETGYRMGARTLRPAKVKVSAAPRPQEQDPAPGRDQ